MDARQVAQQEETIPFIAGDGFQCNLIHVRGAKTPHKGPVLLVHGAGVRANIFRAPVETNFVDYLLDNGYDVWLENWRASIDLPPNRWTLDKAALYDHPKAVQTVVERTGHDRIKAVIHCQGSTSFMMSAVAGLVPQVETIVSNAVSLHTLTLRSAALKVKFALPLVRPLTDYINPQWGLQAPTPIARLIAAYVRLTHYECNNPVCQMSSFTYGTGHPTLWRHENLDERTHEWLKQEFANVPLTFFQQMTRCLDAGHLVATDGFRELPQDFVAQPPQTDARFAFVAGRLNRCFLAEGQRKTYDFFAAQRPEFHSLDIIENYGHLDIFLGHNAVRDTYPCLLAALDRPQ